MATKKTTEEGREPLLSIEAVEPDRRKVMIYGKVYEMRESGEFGLRQRRQIYKLAREMDKSAAHVIADATDFEISESEQAIDEFFGMAFADVPMDVVARMHVEEKREFNLAFYRRFTSATTVTKSETLIAEEADLTRRRLGRLTGGASSLTSKGSTAASAA